MYRHLLVPIDATDLSVELVASAVDFAGSARARITFLHTIPDYAGLPFGNTEAWRTASADDGAGVDARRAREVLVKAEAAAHAYGVPCCSMQAVTKNPSSAIVAAAQSKGCDLVFMASHGGSKPAMALSSETLDAVMHAGLPVLVAASGVLQPPARAIAIIRDEHRSLATVLHAGMHVLAVARSAGDAPDADLMRAIVGYLERFRVAQHHPKEEDYLFRRLRARTPSFDAELDELERQHERDRLLVAAIAGRVEALSAAADDEVRASAVQALEDAVTDYAAFIWEHLGREEGVILPAARRHLTCADWAEIDAAFTNNTDPQFRQLFSRILDLARSRDDLSLLAADVTQQHSMQSTICCHQGPEK